MGHSTTTKRSRRYGVLRAMMSLFGFLILLWSFRTVSLHVDDQTSHSHVPSMQQQRSHPNDTRISQNQRLSIVSIETNNNRTHLWNTSKSQTDLPVWLLHYMEWHSVTRQQALSSPRHFVKHAPRLLVLQCTSRQRVCGGLSDRLKPLPLLLLGAYRTQRLLLIEWKDRPCALEEFMVPPPGGLDWRVPAWLDLTNLGKLLLPRRRPPPLMAVIRRVQNFIDNLEHKPDFMVSATLQWWDGGEQEYKNALRLNKQNREFQHLYHSMFRILFQPTQPIQQRLDQIYQSHPLLQKPYSVAHYRALWWETQDPPSPQEQATVAKNAAHCARQLAPDQAIYFATDSVEAQSVMLQYAQETQRPIVIVKHERLVHLDRVRLDDNVTKLSDIYPVFVDLWLMAQGRCVAYGDGGFGKYGLILSHDYTCFQRHIIRHKVQTCEWVE